MLPLESENVVTPSMHGDHTTHLKQAAGAEEPQRPPNFKKLVDRFFQNVVSSLVFYVYNPAICHHGAVA
jgi:hypothetical protein